MAAARRSVGVGLGPAGWTIRAAALASCRCLYLACAYSTDLRSRCLAVWVATWISAGMRSGGRVGLEAAAGMQAVRAKIRSATERA